LLNQITDGDTFTAGIVVSLLEGNTMIDAVKFATKASSVVATGLGDQSSIPDRTEVKTLLCYKII